MSSDILISAVVVPTIAALIWIIKAQSLSQNKLANSIQNLATHVAYCPMNKSNHDKIKNQFEFKP